MSELKLAALPQEIIDIVETEQRNIEHDKKRIKQHKWTIRSYKASIEASELLIDSILRGAEITLRHVEKQSQDQQYK